VVSWNLVYKQWKPSCAGASPRPRRKRRSLAEVITTDVDEDSVHKIVQKGNLHISDTLLSCPARSFF
jgi:hypothetical protein